MDFLKFLFIVWSICAEVEIVMNSQVKIELGEKQISLSMCIVHSWISILGPTLPI